MPALDILLLVSLHLLFQVKVEFGPLLRFVILEQFLELFEVFGVYEFAGGRVLQQRVFEFVTLQGCLDFWERFHHF